MITVKTFIFNPFQENTYLLYDETKECIIVDAGCYTQSERAELEDFINQNQLEPKFAIITHGHIDHILGNAFIKERFNIEILGQPEDLFLIQSAVNHALMFGLSIDDVPSIDRNINDGDVLKFGNSTLRVIHTPGHSLGGICLYSDTDNFVITGDTLFRESIGRTDLPGGNYNQIIETIKTKLLSLSENVKVYPGHGEPSTIGWERGNNPYL
jgi:hydroxyacylglutathione hydrolase